VPCSHSFFCLSGVTAVLEAVALVGPELGHDLTVPGITGR
jgi:hypothetical protein